MGHHILQLRKMFKDMGKPSFARRMGGMGNMMGCRGGVLLQPCLAARAIDRFAMLALSLIPAPFADSSLISTVQQMRGK